MTNFPKCCGCMPSKTLSHMRTILPAMRATMRDKSIETLGSKIQFLNVLDTFFPLPSQTMLIFLFLRLHRPQHLHNIELGGQVYQRINARWKYNRTILLEYQKASFCKSVSTTFVAHYKSEIGYRFQGLGCSPQQKC